MSTAGRDELSAVLTMSLSHHDTVTSINARLEELFEGLGDTGPDRVQLLQSFLSKVAVDVDQVDGAVAANDAEALRSRAHSVKGRAGNIGALHVAEVAAFIEDAARDGEMEQTPHAAAILRRTVAEANDHIRAMLAALTSTP